MDELPTQQIGPYRISRVLGRGGMGVVYVGVTDEGQEAAVKVMAPELARNREFRERFLREAEIVVDHPNVVPIYDAGAMGDLLYIAMYLVRGGDLRGQIQREGRLLPARAVWVAREAAAALDAAHAGGIVHRDVKPSNFLLDEAAPEAPAGRLYLSDFGLVKQVSATETSLTGGAHLVGTAHYMSPEQIRGRTLDGRADVYSLACVVYECLTGSPPYQAGEEVAVLWAHVHDPVPSVSEKVPVLPDAIDAVIARAMAKDPSDRYLTAGEFAADVGATLGLSASAGTGWPSLAIDSITHPPRARPTAAALPAPPPPRRIGWIIGIAGIILALVAFVARSGEAPEPLSDALPELFAEEDPPGPSPTPDGPSPDDGRRGERGRDLNRTGTRPRRHRLVVPPTVPTTGPPSVAVVDDTRNGTPSVKARHPRYGTYVFDQAGYEQLCPRQGGSCLDDGGRLPDDHVLRVSRYGFSDPPVISAVAETSPRLTTRSAIRFATGKATLKAMEITVDTRYADFTVQLDPEFGVDWMRFPLRVGSEWRGSWSSGPTPGTLWVEVTDKATTVVNARSIPTIKTHLVLSWDGSHAGDLDVNNWVDARTGMILESAGTLRTATGFSDYLYEAAFRTVLRGGPGYDGG